MASQYSFGEYSAAWPAAFAQETSRLQALLGDELVMIHHPADINAYNNAKDAWIKTTERRALAWYGQQQGSA